MDLINWQVRSSIRRGGDGVKWLNGGYRYFSQLRVPLNIDSPYIIDSVKQENTQYANSKNLPLGSKTFSFLMKCFNWFLGYVS